MPTEAIVLVGGQGRRLRSIVSDRPKPMALVAGKPFLDWLLCQLRHKGIKRVILATGYRGEMVAAYCQQGKRWGLEVTYAHEKSPLGTGGALLQALSQTVEKNVYLLNGDSYVEWSPATLVQSHRTHQAIITLTLSHVADCAQSGQVFTQDNSLVTAFNEKQGGGPGWVNAGVYLIDVPQLLAMPFEAPCSLECDMIPRLIKQGLPVAADKCDGTVFDIGTVENYLSATDILEESLSGLEVSHEA